MMSSLRSYQFQSVFDLRERGEGFAFGPDIQLHFIEIQKYQMLKQQGKISHPPFDPHDPFLNHWMDFLGTWFFLAIRRGKERGVIEAKRQPDKRSDQPAIPGALFHQKMVFFLMKLQKTSYQARLGLNCSFYGDI